MNRNTKKEVGIYLHIPFCVKKCAYCDFLSFPADDGARETYVQALIKEIKSYQGRQDYEVPTIFFGGGTPSVLTCDQLERILNAVYETFSVNENAEISMEMNPGTVGGREFFLPQKINRVSIGLQSVKNEELQQLGRIHTYEDFLHTYNRLRELGIANINIDLISAIPKQTVASWEDTLRTVAALHPEHISAYSLIVEEGTPFYEMQLDLPSEEEERKIYEITETVLDEYGYHRYEISNYARPGYECRHNSSYWKRTDYLGLGLGASSLIDNHRFKNTDSMERYLKCCEKPDEMREEYETLSKTAQMEECMFLGLRMMEGISEEDFQNQFGQSIDKVYEKPLKEMIERGLLEKEGNRIRLTKRGIDVSNQVMAEFLLS